MRDLRKDVGLALDLFADPGSSTPLTDLSSRSSSRPRRRTPTSTSAPSCGSTGTGSIAPLERPERRARCRACAAEPRERLIFDRPSGAAFMTSGRAQGH